jgi:hypothetical protein
MKKIIIILLIALGAFVKIFAQVSEKFEQKILLSPDKSTVSVINITEYKKYFVFNKKDSVITSIVHDTIAKYYVSTDALNYINDSLAYQVITSSYQLVNISDSLVPRFTHLFGKDKYVIRNLQVEDGNWICYRCVRSELRRAINYDLLKVPCCLAVIMFLFSIFFIVKIKIKFFSVIISTVLFFAIIMSYSQCPNFTIFDIFIFLAIVIVPILLTLFIKIKKST